MNIRILTVVTGASLFGAFCAQAVTTAKSYVQNGLVAHWDAIENAGYGLHDGSTNVWTDLKGLADLTIVDTKTTWSEKALVPPTSGDLGTIAIDQAKVVGYAKYCVIDLCASRHGVGDASAILGQDSRTVSWTKNGFVCQNTTARSCLAAMTKGTPYSLYASYVANSPNVATNYLDGLAIASSADTHTALANGSNFQIGRSVNAYWSTHAPVHAVRLYSRALEPWEIQLNANVDQIRYRGTDGATLTWPDGLRYADGSVEYRTLASAKTFSKAAANDNRIAVSGGGESAASVAAWKPAEGTRTLTPVPDALHRYLYWSGDIEGLEISATGVVTLDNKFRTLVCHFVAADSQAAIRTWSGAVGTDDWGNPANWTPSGAPGADDVIKIPSGARVVAGETTAALSALDCFGTLVLSNWTTRLNAELITIRNGGVLTCADAILSGAATVSASYADQTFSRVDIACEDLTVKAGGTIDLRLKGWMGAPGTIHCRGYGPGSTAARFGAAHGGHGGGATGGGFEGGNKLTPPSMPYDDPAAPVQPGSSGGSYYGSGNKFRGSSGGGVLRLAARGSVTVNGTVTADGQDAAGYGMSSVGSKFADAASGGSIYITCHTLAGDGVISANGGGGDYPFNANWQGHAAGGGCIAIYYDAAAQTAEAVRGMKITAAAGLYKAGTFNPGIVGEAGRNNADIGTLRFTDRKLVDALLGKGLTGQLAGLSPYVYTGDLAFNYGHVRFADPGSAVTVTGNLTFGGTDCRLEFGGCEAKWRTVHVDIYGDNEVNRLTVGGNLTLGGVSRLDIRSAETNGVDTCGALVKVGGTMTVGSNCFVYAWSDVLNTGSPHFDVGSLNVVTGGTFTATRRGGAGAYKSSFWVYGKSSGKDEYVGGGHGGTGGWATANAGCVSDNAVRPTLVGAGGGTASGYSQGGAGGGIVWVTATNGTIRVDGMVSADGEAETGYGSAGAGGSVLLEAHQLVVGETGSVTVKGGNVKPSSTHAGGGGGGRIALYAGQPWSATLPRSRTVVSQEPFAAETYPDEFSFLGTADASGGIVSGGTTANGKAGEAGTIRYCYVKEPSGMMLLIH